MRSVPEVKGQPAQTYLTLGRCCTRDLNAILWVGEQMMSRRDKPNVSTIRFCDFARRVTETYAIESYISIDACLWHAQVYMPGPSARAARAET